MFPAHVRKEIHGVATDIVIQAFSDRILVLVTQLGKVGNLIQVSVPQTTSLAPNPIFNSADLDALSLPPLPTAIQLTHLFGAAPSERIRTLHDLYASQIATIIWAHEAEGQFAAARRSIIVGIALKRTGNDAEIDPSALESEVFKAVMSMLRDLLQSG